MSSRSKGFAYSAAILEELERTAQSVRSARSFELWVREQLRTVFPHEIFVAALGRIYNVGSVPTHFLTVDFPLTYTENLKNSAGAIESPVMNRWLASGRPQVFELGATYWPEATAQWLDNFIQHDVRNVIAHGLVDRQSRRFAAFNFGRLPGAITEQHVLFVERINPILFEAAWRTVEARAKPRTTQMPPVILADAEAEIIGLVARGLSNKEIARMRGISESTVKTYLGRASAKLGARRRSELVNLAMPMLTVFPPFAGEAEEEPTSEEPDQAA